MSKISFTVYDPEDDPYAIMYSIWCESGYFEEYLMGPGEWTSGTVGASVGFQLDLSSSGYAGASIGMLSTDGEILYYDRSGYVEIALGADDVNVIIWVAAAGQKGNIFVTVYDQNLNTNTIEYDAYDAAHYLGRFSYPVTFDGQDLESGISISVLSSGMKETNITNVVGDYDSWYGNQVWIDFAATDRTVDIYTTYVNKVKIKINGNWVGIDEILIKQNGNWSDTITGMYVKQSGSWLEIWNDN